MCEAAANRRQPQPAGDMNVSVPPWCFERLALNNRENLCFSKLKSEINSPFDVTGMLKILRSQSL